jgi:hypothetical protein
MPNQEVAPLSSFLGTALKGGAIAAVLNVAFYLATSAAGVEYTGQIQPGGPMDAAVPAPMFAISSLIPALFAGLLAWAMRKKTEKAGVIFLGISIVFAFLSLGGPIGLAGASLGTKVALSVTHFIAAVPITLALVRGPLRIN